MTVNQTSLSESYQITNDLFYPIARPCQRCIKRDLAGTCTDGARKKAKYLQDAEGKLLF